MGCRCSKYSAIGYSPDALSDLGSFVMSDGKCNIEILTRIEMTKTIFHSMSNVFLKQASNWKQE